MDNCGGSLSAYYSEIGFALRREAGGEIDVHRAKSVPYVPNMSSPSSYKPQSHSSKPVFPKVFGCGPQMAFVHVGCTYQYFPF